MTFLDRIALFSLHRFDPEVAHGLSIKALKSGLTPKPGPVRRPRLETQLAGLKFANPVGLAAGYDKNAEAITPLSQAGFGFIEVGAATPKPQDGNPKPRLFRLTKDRAVINRFGFNNQGVNKITDRLSAATSYVPCGLNLGANKDSKDRAQDYATVLGIAGPHIDFATINVSSPNTEKLRDLQGKAALEDLLGQVQDANDALEKPVPLFLKIAPDLTEAEIQDIADLTLDAGLDAIIATNTTLDRTGLTSHHAGQAGGLSGRPLFEKSTRVLAKLATATEGNIPLIGVGGVAGAQDAYEKIKAGATLVQLYSAMVYQGLSIACDVAVGLDELLHRDGYDHVGEAIGCDMETWL